MTKYQEFSKLQLSGLNRKDNLHLLIERKVYDLHEFVNEHPGGDLVLLGEAGGDATKAWEDVQHTDEAKGLMKNYLVGYCSEVSSRPDTSRQMAIEVKKASSYVLLLFSVCLVLLLALYLGSWPFDV